MRFGPTSLQLTSVLARGLHRPKLRPDLIASEQVMAGQKSFVIKIPETTTYARYGAYEFELFQLCDGTRTPAEIAEEMSRRHPERPVSEQEVAEFVENADPNTWERSLGDKNLAILERIREERKSRVDQSNLLYISFSAWDSDPVLTRIHPYLRWIYSPGFVIFSLCMFAVTLAVVIGDYVRIRQDTVEFYTFTHKSAYDILIFWVLLFVISGIHEFGHGLTCKHFGGEVPHMGLMLIYFTPAFFTDCTEMCMFDRTSKRLWTIFAGIWVELVACGIATLIWYFSPPGSFIGDLGYKTLLLTGVSGVFINLNPLMKFDGYYALSQYLEMENLREDSFEYLKVWAQRYLLRRPIDLPPATRRERRAFLIFAPAAMGYGLLVLLLVSGWLKNVFVNEYGGLWGYPLTALAVYLMLRKRLRKWAPAWREGWRGAKGKFMAWKMSRGQQAGAVAALAVLVAVPTPTKISTEFIVEPLARSDVRATVPAWVKEIPIREGQQIAAGAVLATLRNPDLEAHFTEAQAQFELAQRTLLTAEAENNDQKIAKYTQETQRWSASLADARGKLAGLVLRAPHAGIVTTPQISQRLGEYVDAGEIFATVADRRQLKARILVRDWQVEDVQPGAQVRLKVRSYPFRTFLGYVAQILPATAVDRPVAEPQKLERKGQELTNYLAVVLTFNNPSGELLEGMTGTAKIYGHHRSIAWQAGRATWRWFRSQIW